MHRVKQEKRIEQKKGKKERKKRRRKREKEREKDFERIRYTFVVNERKSMLKSLDVYLNQSRKKKKKIYYSIKIEVE